MMPPRKTRRLLSLLVLLPLLTAPARADMTDREVMSTAHSYNDLLARLQTRQHFDFACEASPESDQSALGRPVPRDENKIALPMVWRRHQRLALKYPVRVGDD